ncbi:patatin-like phospholipase family protein [Roseibium sp.]|uniref:patatin-like phospholipase family protein n=1 Tax=Roseibium sp. TaxID=1936156 RepID=UPI003BA97668
MSTIKRFCLLATISLAVASCAGNGITHQPLPEDLVEGASVLNFETARTWADAFSPGYSATLKTREKQIRASGLASGDVNILVLSGGGQNGAFGAGYLNGWTKRGDRPQFEIVTGVSTGALIAPLAFLGPKYDADLERFYTTHSTRDIIKPNYIAGLLSGAAVTDSKPLASLIAEFVTPEFLAEVAREHRRGRRLALITTNIEAQRPVIWDMGQIAEAGTVESVDLFRKVVLASASIPGAFPPVQIDVVADGQTYSELHVDGATTTNLFLAPLNLTVFNDTPKRRGRIFILTNGKYLPEYRPVKAKTIPLAGRAFSTLLKYSTKADVQRLQLFADRTGAELRFVSIPIEFDEDSTEPFDKDYMNALYDFGYGAGERRDLETSRPRVF